ncbi:MAG TPA: YgiQ family radical SAM protein, partial [Spirochaetota bacterium]|nr:YgiQ family radical SAM protein [Spirochaetota bacterium]
MIHYLPDKKTDAVDVLLVSGDAYIDCPSFGIAIIARVIEFAGFSVCIVSQPEYYIDSYLETLPEVKLFIGITSGNMDSVVSNYTSSRNIRKTDDFSLDGEPYFENGARKRPDRATIFYTSYFKKRYKNVPVVLGGIEASLRRAAHYDYVQQKIRKSILIDSKADIIVYSMGEKAIVEIAKRLSSGLSLDGIRGTAVKKKNIDDLGKFIELPSYNDILKDKSLLIKTTSVMEENMVWD